MYKAYRTGINDKVAPGWPEPALSSTSKAKCLEKLTAVSSSVDHVESMDIIYKF